MGRDLPISPKVSREIAAAIRGMKVSDAKAFLEKVVAKEVAVPYKRFNRKVGHKKGMASGRYPVKASTYFLKTLANAQSNAEGEDLIISHISVNRGRVQHGGYKGRPSNTLITHIQVILDETEKGDTNGD